MAGFEANFGHIGGRICGRIASDFMENMVDKLKMDFGQNLRPISAEFAADYAIDSGRNAMINFSYKLLKLTLWFLSLGKGWFWAVTGGMDLNKFS